MYSQAKIRRLEKSKSADELVIEEARRLSTEQRHIIRETFKVLYEHPLKYGQTIFVRLIGNFPEYKKIWPQFRGIPDSSIVVADAVKRHACVYMAGLKTIIDNMENEYKMAEMLKKIAISHLKWNIQKSHVMNMVPELIFVLHTCTGKEDKSADEAWITLYDVIGNLIDKFKAIQSKSCEASRKFRG